MNGPKRSKAPDALTGLGQTPTPYKLSPGLVTLLEKGAHPIMRQCFDLVVIAAGHVVVIDQGVDDGFFGRFDGGGEKRVDQVVRHGFDGTNRWFGVGGMRVGGGEGDEQIAGAVVGNAAGAGKTERSATGQTLQLMRG